MADPEPIGLGIVGLGMAGAVMVPDGCSRFSASGCSASFSARTIRVTSSPSELKAVATSPPMAPAPRIVCFMRCLLAAQTV